MARKRGGAKRRIPALAAYYARRAGRVGIPFKTRGRRRKGRRR